MANVHPQWQAPMPPMPYYPYVAALQYQQQPSQYQPQHQPPHAQASQNNRNQGQW